MICLVLRGGDLSPWGWPVLRGDDLSSEGATCPQRGRSVLRGGDPSSEGATSPQRGDPSSEGTISPQRGRPVLRGDDQSPEGTTSPQRGRPVLRSGWVECLENELFLRRNRSRITEWFSTNLVNSCRHACIMYMYIFNSSDALLWESVTRPITSFNIHSFSLCTAWG